MKTGIVTDSTSDLPREIIKKWGIAVVPTLIMMDGTTYKDGEGMSREEFYELLPGMQNPPTTAAPSPEAFQNVYQSQIQQGCDQILVITAPAGLSGIHNAASIAAEEYQGNITVFDSGQLGMGIGFQVIEAVKMAADNFSIQKITNHLIEMGKRIKLYAMLDTTKQLKRSGRVSWARSMVSDLLQIKPFIQLEQGVVHKSGFARTRTAGKLRLEKLLTGFGMMDYLAVCHTNAYDEAVELLNLIKDRVKTDPLIINVTTIIGNHVGSNGLGFVAVPERKQSTVR